MSHPDGPEQREAERLERDTYDHDTAADRADEDRLALEDGSYCAYWLNRVTP